MNTMYSRTFSQMPFRNYNGKDIYVKFQTDITV